MDLEYLNNLHDEIKKFNKELLDEQKDLNKKLSDVDKKISDLYHEIEFTEVKHISEGVFVLQKIKDTFK